MRDWRQIKKALKLEQKQEIIYNEVELIEIEILPEDWDFDVKFIYDYPNFDPEHGFVVKLKNWKVIDVYEQ